MPRPARRSRDRRPGISPALWAMLNDAPTPEGISSREEFFLAESDLKAVWGSCREEILAEWIEHSPGTRPSHWWRFDAPEPRCRLGGIGTPAAECLAYAPHCTYGIPVDWLDSWSAAYYRGEAVDVHGARLNPEASPEDFPYPAVDPDDPPRYESQATYLRRLHLLTPTELKLYRASALDTAEEVLDADTVDVLDEEGD